MDCSKVLNISADVLQNYLYGKKCNFIGTRQNNGQPSGSERNQTNGSGDNSSDKIALMEKFFRDYISLPKQIKIQGSTIPGETLGVFSVSWIKEGTQMGPYTGHVVKVSQVRQEELNDYMWEIFDESGQMTHFINGQVELHRNWLCHVRCARSDQEQNLDIVQYGSTVHYRACKDIPPNQELLVWYPNVQQQFLGIPERYSHYPESNRGRRRPETKGTTQFLHNGKVFVSPGRLRCTVCRRGFNSRSNLRSHMRIHTMEKPFECKFCKKSFSQSSTLRNHTRLHTGEKPYKCHVCAMAYSQLAGLRAHQKSARHRPNGIGELLFDSVSMVAAHKIGNHREFTNCHNTEKKSIKNSWC